MKGVFLGFDSNGPVTYNKDAHILTIAQSGAGKNTSLIMPNLLMDIFDGSKIILDLKGENSAVCGGWKDAEKRGNTYNINPWGIFGQNTNVFNPFCILDAYDDGLFLECYEFAKAIVIEKKTSGGNDNHFDGMAQDFIASILMFLTIKNTIEAEEKEEEPNAPNPASLLDAFSEYTVSVDNLKKLVDEMLEINHPDEFIKRGLEHCARTLLSTTGGGDNGELRGIKTTVGRGLISFRDKVLAKAVMADNSNSKELFDIMFYDTIKGNHDLYISFPQSNMDSARVWLRLLLTAFTRQLIAKPPTRPILFVLDEFPQLGTFNTIVKNAAYLRGYGVRFWFIGQNIGQLKDNYGDAGMQTIMENCTVRQFFNVTDETARYVSEKMGKVQTIIKNMGTNEYRSTKEDYVMTRTEVERTPMIMSFIGNSTAVLTGKKPYYEIPLTNKRAKPNPLHHGLEAYKKADERQGYKIQVLKEWGSMERYGAYLKQAGILTGKGNPSEEEKAAASKEMSRLANEAKRVTNLVK